MRFLCLASITLFATFGCSSTASTGSDGGQDAAQDSDTATGDDASTLDSGDDATSAVTLKAPAITMVASMAGGLHVMWTNRQTDCDAIDGERKSDTEAYALAFTVPDGSVDNKHDAPLTSGKTYTYRLRCKKGADYSPYSNEKSGTP